MALYGREITSYFRLFTKTKKYSIISIETLKKGRFHMTTTNKKPIKKAMLSTLDAILDTAEDMISLGSSEVTYADLHDFIAHEIQLLENKSAAAKERSAKKKEEGDILREKIYDALSDTTYMTINDILEVLNDKDITSPMVVARLTQLAAPEVNRVVKETMTVASSNEGGKSKKLSAYRRNV
jgi:DNA-binding SARP family transcriptional activator